MERDEAGLAIPERAVVVPGGGGGSILPLADEEDETVREEEGGLVGAPAPRREDSDMDLAAKRGRGGGGWEGRERRCLRVETKRVSLSFLDSALVAAVLHLKAIRSQESQETQRLENILEMPRWQ